MFGKEGEGVHQTRFLGMAAFDLVGTVLIAAIVAAGIAVVFAVSFLRTFFATFAILMILAILAHRFYCVDTALIVWLFGRRWEHT
jgi:hypothetical protein